METHPVRARRAIVPTADQCPTGSDSKEKTQKNPESFIESEPDAGAATAEYAILTLAAVAFAGVLAVVVKSGAVQQLLQGVIERALGT